MEKHHLDAKYDGHKHKISVDLEIITWNEGETNFYYSPALDMTGYGNTEAEASQSFNFQLKEFVTYTLNKGTVYDELERLGWTVDKKKRSLVAPGQNDLLAENETYRNLVQMAGISKVSTNFELAL